MASKNDKPTAAPEGVIDTKSDLLAELNEVTVAPEGHKVEKLDKGTVRSTNTVYEDRTIHPEVEKVVEFELTQKELGNGTIYTDVGPAKGAE